MTSTSRMDTHSSKAATVAAKGNWNMIGKLYSSEMERMKKQWGVTITPLKPFENAEALCLISWADAFPEGLDYQQSWYISFVVDDMPKTDNYAQLLFLTTARAIAKQL